MSAELAEARDLLVGARRLLVLTGAGISAESGVPTFRGPEGLWRFHRPEELATPQAFRKDPLLVWGWYAWRRARVTACAPNAGHRALARWALHGGRRVTLVTQNVDGLHEMAARDEAGAGDPGPALPLHLHGSLFGDRCSGCGARSPGSATVDASSLESLPRCRLCGALLRPDVVWFGESLDPRVLDEAFHAATEADVCLAVGTSGVVHPAASIPIATVQAGGALVEVDPGETALSEWATIRVRGAAARVLPDLLPLHGVGAVRDRPPGQETP